MKVAVIGGGLFGCTAAVYAARAGHEVHLYEVKPKLMQGATSCCYYRLHRGYHYPRSDETALESLEAEHSFREEYGECVIDGGQQFYAIPGIAQVTPDEFAEFMQRIGIPFERHRDHLFRVEEPRLDAFMLSVLVHRRVEAAGVHVHLNSDITNSPPEFDCVVVATYAGLNRVMDAFGLPQTDYKFQVVEKPIVRISKELENTSIVVMDVCCIDPHQYTDCHALGHVSKTIHAENGGYEVAIPEEIRPYIELGVIRYWVGFEHSKVFDVLCSIAAYVPAVRNAEYIGSQYTVRAVLAHQEETDARPTLVERYGNVIKVFSGKLGTAVVAAQEVVGHLQQIRGLEAA